MTFTPRRQPRSKPHKMRERVTGPERPVPYPSSWRDLLPRSHAGVGCLNKPENTAPSNSNLFPDSTIRVSLAPSRLRSGACQMKRLWSTDGLAERWTHSPDYLRPTVDHGEQAKLGLMCQLAFRREHAHLAGPVGAGDAKPVQDAGEDCPLDRELELSIGSRRSAGNCAHQRALRRNNTRPHGMHYRCTHETAPVERSTPSTWHRISAGFRVGSSDTAESPISTVKATTQLARLN